MLIFYYGDECPHCDKMQKLIKKLFDNEGIEITKKEVWHDKDNLQEFEALDQKMCGGVPFFWNAETRRWICGECKYEILKAWAKGEEFSQE